MFQSNTVHNNNVDNASSIGIYCSGFSFYMMRSMICIAWTCTDW